MPIRPNTVLLSILEAALILCPIIVLICCFSYHTIFICVLLDNPGLFSHVIPIDLIPNGFAVFKSSLLSLVSSRVPRSCPETLFLVLYEASLSRFTIGVEPFHECSFQAVMAVVQLLIFFSAVHPLDLLSV